MLKVRKWRRITFFYFYSNAEINNIPNKLSILMKILLIQIVTLIIENLYWILFVVKKSANLYSKITFNFKTNKKKTIIKELASLCFFSLNAYLQTGSIVLSSPPYDSLIIMLVSLGVD